MLSRRTNLPDWYIPEHEKLFGLFHLNYGEDRESSMHGVLLRLPGRKRYGIYVAPYSEWRTVADGRPVQDEKSFVVVSRNSAARAVLAAARKAYFGIVLADDIQWSRIGHRFRVSCLTSASDRPDGTNRGRTVIEYARSRIAAAHQALKASSLYGMA